VRILGIGDRTLGKGESGVRFVIIGLSNVTGVSTGEKGDSNVSGVKIDGGGGPIVCSFQEPKQLPQRRLAAFNNAVMGASVTQSWPDVKAK
jgi:hypothetical protein